MLGLASSGWRHKALNNGDFYADSQLRECVFDYKRPRLYFLVLACSLHIFGLFPKDDAITPIITHCMPSNYYKVLTPATRVEAIADLLAIIDAAPDARNLSDKSFAALVATLGV